MGLYMLYIQLLFGTRRTCCCYDGYDDMRLPLSDLTLLSAQAPSRSCTAQQMGNDVRVCALRATNRAQRTQLAHTHSCQSEPPACPNRRHEKCYCNFGSTQPIALHHFARAYCLHRRLCLPSPQTEMQATTTSGHPSISFQQAGFSPEQRLQAASCHMSSVSLPVLHPADPYPPRYPLPYPLPRTTCCTFCTFCHISFSPKRQIFEGYAFGCRTGKSDAW